MHYFFKTTVLKSFILENKFDPSMDTNYDCGMKHGTEPNKSKTRVRISEYPCCMCKDVFATEARLFDHYSTIHSDELDDNFCKICQQSFSTENVFKIHNFVVHTDSQISFPEELSPRETRKQLQIFLSGEGGNEKHSYACSVCGGRFFREDLLTEHMKDHSDNKPYKYSSCGDKISNTFELNVHISTKQKTTSEISPGTCNLRRESMSRPKTLLNECTPQSAPQLSLNFANMLLASNIDGKFNACSSDCNDCSVCDALLLSKDLQVEHENDFSFATLSSQCVPELRCDSSSELPLLLNVADESNSHYNCSVCEAQFLSQDLLAQHMNNCKSHISHKCPGCDKFFSAKPELIIHLSTDHNEKKVFCCLSCESVFVSRLQLQEHNHACVPENSYSYNLGDTKFSNKNSLSKQQNKERIECPICAKMFTSEYLLMKHLPSHTGNTHCECDKCDRKFFYKNHLRLHRLTHWGEKNNKKDVSVACFDCSKCNKKFFTVLKLKNYLRTEHKLKIFNCTSCKSAFVSAIKLEEHYLTCARENWFSCVMCEAKFSNKDSLHVHLMKHKNGERFVCTICGKKFVYKYSLKEHFSKNTEERLFECDKCSRKLAYKNALRCNTLKNNRNSSADLEEDPVNNGSFACPKCNKKFIDAVKLKIHLRGAHSVKQHVVCASCESVFASMNQLREHYLVCSPKVWFSCEKCGAKFRIKESLQVHLFKHSARKRFPCPPSDMTFHYKYSLRDHLVKHTGERPYECDKCHKKFSHKYTLRMHKLTHENSPARNALDENRSGNGRTVSDINSTLFECPKCDKKFAVSELKTHLLSEHNVKRSFQCSSCKSVFVSGMHLHEHYRTCTPGDLFPCNICDSKFKQKRYLLLHIKKHHAVKQFACLFCERTFTYNFKLKAHMRMHTGERPFECEMCNKKFNHHYSLKIHRQTHHGDSTEQGPLSNNVPLSECLKCGKKFSTALRLKNHLRAEHDVKRIYGCNSCESVFVSVLQLRTHYLDCAPKKWFSCNLCGAKFAQMNSLRVHLSKHRTGKRHACDFCEKKFAYECLLKQHLRRHTREMRHEGFDCEKCDMNFSNEKSASLHRLAHENSEKNHAT